jgi:hypothetical protein
MEAYNLYSVMVSEKCLKKEEFETILDLIDTVNTMSSSYYDLQLNQRFDSEVEFDKNIIMGELSETVCVIDS